MNKRIVFICMSVIAQRAVTGARAAPTERTFCPPSLVGYCAPLIENRRLCSYFHIKTMLFCQGAFVLSISGVSKDGRKSRTSTTREIKVDANLTCKVNESCFVFGYTTIYYYSSHFFLM